MTKKVGLNKERKNLRDKYPGGTVDLFLTRENERKRKKENGEKQKKEIENETKTEAERKSRCERESRNMSYIEALKVTEFTSENGVPSQFNELSFNSCEFG